MTQRKLRICFVCTHSFTLATLYKGLFPYLRDRGYEIEVIVGDREYTAFDPVLFGPLTPHIIPMQRTPHPVRDLKSLARFISFFRRNRFDIIHVSTPKAALLGSIAAKLTRNGKVVFVHRRLIYQMWSGLKRRLYEQNDRVTAAFSDLVVPVSRQIRDVLVDRRLVPAGKVKVIGRGASNGTDIRRFSPDAVGADEVQALRTSLAIPATAPVLLYLSRVSREKGVDLLPAVLDRVRQVHEDAILVVAGPLDDREPLDSDTAERMATDPNIRRVGFIDNPSPYYALADVFVFPSFFEGIANALLEVAAHERPVVGFRVPGVEESVDDGKSGILVPAGDVAAMADAVTGLLSHPAERLRMGKIAREWVTSNFSNEVVWAGLDHALRELVTQRASQ